jgi:hypothetical protein
MGIDETKNPFIVSSRPSPTIQSRAEGLNPVIREF